MHAKDLIRGHEIKYSHLASSSCRQTDPLALGQATDSSAAQTQCNTERAPIKHKSNHLMNTFNRSFYLTIRTYNHVHVSSHKQNYVKLNYAYAKLPLSFGKDYMYTEVNITHQQPPTPTIPKYFF